MSKILWILTEERPKIEVLRNILMKFCWDNNFACFIDKMRIIPILDVNWKFTFTYELLGIRSEKIQKVFIETISGKWSFVDFLLFYQDKEPTQQDIPVYAIEETKTDDAESRNTWIFQRASKFVYLDFFYPNIKKIMLYNLQVKQKTTPTNTNIFWTRCLFALDVEILWKEQWELLPPFKNIDELILFKNGMRRPPAWNVPILINKTDSNISISGRLYKAGSLSHDPNIGALSLICATLRKLWWNKKITITQHWLEQKHIKWNNKFVHIANVLDVDFDGLTRVKEEKKKWYWKYETEGEKLWTIFIHLVVENFTTWGSIFENHAGCEKWYFIKKDGTPIVLEKYTDREKYKWGDKTQIFNIPDLILIDFERLEIINVEGKKYIYRTNWINELNNYGPIETLYIKPNYPEYKIIRTVVLYWWEDEKIIEIEVGFLLNSKGKLILWIKAPDIFKDALKNLIDFWSK